MSRWNERSDATLPGGQSTDALLQASRRLDWRFLLGGPELDRVLYAGRPQGTLWESLRLFSGSLSVLEATELGAAAYDVGVARNPKPQALRHLTSLLRPGGWLYAEIDGPFAQRYSLRREGPRLPHDYRRLLERLGMEEIEIYWHWPDFETCTTIAPLDDPAALSYLLKRARKGRGVPFPPAVGRWLLRSGLLALVVPSFSIVARRGERASGQRASAGGPASADLAGGL